MRKNGNFCKNLCFQIRDITCGFATRFFRLSKQDGGLFSSKGINCGAYASETFRCICTTIDAEYKDEQKVKTRSENCEETDISVLSNQEELKSKVRSLAEIKKRLNVTRFR